MPPESVDDGSAAAAQALRVGDLTLGETLARRAATVGVAGHPADLAQDLAWQAAVARPQKYSTPSTRTNSRKPI